MRRTTTSPEEVQRGDDQVLLTFALDYPHIFDRLIGSVDDRGRAEYAARLRNAGADEHTIAAAGLGDYCIH